MPRKTKRELLQEKTVEELKDMARDRDLSGYSNMVKDELIELINSNYTKAEIKAWPEEEKESEETPKEKSTEEATVEVEEEPGPTEIVEVDEDFGAGEIVEVDEGLGEMPEREEVREEAETFRNMLIGLIIVLVLVVIIAITYAAGFL